MSDMLYRYPGAQPFRDNELSRRTFFGRESASTALTDQILANRLVIVYAKSGLGKTSLLNAGVAPRLREADSLPLFVRVNDIQHGPLVSVLEGIRAEAERQQVEYVPGQSASLWNFFKSVEFWRGDFLLTPVLILDQFEELFTLQSEEEREKFLSELGYLVRGIPPPSSSQVDSNVSDAAPSVRVVLSLREDFLGILEEASDRIPQIMDHRFRLAPLTHETATKAITGPAAIDDPDMATKPFRLEPEFVTSILDYLTKSTAGARSSGSRYVEPFHLQLICQRIEKIVAFKQKASSEEIVVSSKDLGGEAALAQTLASFYNDAIRSLPGRQLRGSARRLCEEFLISPEGRRLSVEERELQRQLRLPHETLSQLVERRLLRTDRRSDSTYYELSHDALVQPVLASRRTQALIVGWFAVLGGSILSLPAGVLLIVCAWELFFNKKWVRDMGYAAFIFLVAAMLSIGAIGILWLRGGIRRRNRYRRRAPGDLTQPLPTRLTVRARALAWVTLVTGSSIFALWGLAGLYILVVFGSLFFLHGQFPHWLAWAKDEDLVDSWQQMRDRPFVELPWLVAEVSTIIVFGWMLLRRSARKLWPNTFPGRSQPSPVPGFDQPPLPVWTSFKVVSGSMAFGVAALGFFILRRCVSVWHGSVPYRLLQTIIASEVFSDACEKLYRKDYWNLDVVSLVLFLFSAFIFSIALLRSGILDVRGALRHRQFTRLVWAKVGATACGILIVASLLSWALLRLRSSEQTRGTGEQQAQAAASNPQSITPQSGWAVGNDATILHTDDGGHTWKAQTRGTGWLYSVAFATPLSGWATGGGGTIWNTQNGGDTWEVQTSGTRVNLSVVAFATPQSGWAVGDKGTILHTEDGGGTWKPQTSGTSEDLRSVVLATSQSGWVVGADGTILHTEEGGGAWKPQTSGTIRTLYGIAFATPQSGWVVGDKGTILHTEDGGGTWKPQSSGTSKDLRSVAFATPQSGWVVGRNGIILHTEDAGGSWKPQTSGTIRTLYGIACAAPQSGWVVGRKGTILHTEDGGRTWTLQTSDASADLQSVTSARPRGFIGVEFSRKPNPATARDHSLSSGVTITKVTPGGPADRAGLKAGDAIASVNGKQVKTGDELLVELSTLKPGTDAKLGYVRNGKSMTVSVIIADRSRLLASRIGH